MVSWAWITGASSGIGAACVSAAPSSMEVTGVSRSIPDVGRHLRADLSRPDDWVVLLDDIRHRLVHNDIDRAYLVHLAGTTAPAGPAAQADSDDYLTAFLLNAASTIALGQQFLAACNESRVPGTVVVCSSPSATDVTPGLSQYSAAKAAVEQWARVVAAEESVSGTNRVLAVVPYAVDTPMVRELMEDPAKAGPLTAHFRDMQRRGELASPAETAQHIWQAALAEQLTDPVVAVGARHLAPN